MEDNFFLSVFKFLIVLFLIENVLVISKFVWPVEIEQWGHSRYDVEPITSV